MIAPQTNSRSFKIRINFVSKIYWFKVHVFFAFKTTYNMFQRLPVGGEGGEEGRGGGQFQVLFLLIW